MDYPVLLKTLSVPILFPVYFIFAWICGFFTRGKGFGLIGNFVVGYIGAFTGIFLLKRLGWGLGSDNGAGMLGLALVWFVGTLIIAIVLRVVWPPRASN